MVNKQRHEMIALFQSRTAMINPEDCIKILERFQWNCLEAINYVLENIEVIKIRPSNLARTALIRPSPAFEQPLLPSGCLDELEGIRHFESAFRHRHRTASRWPVWFKSTLENALNQPHRPLAVFLNHDGSVFTTSFSRQILCSPSILNVLAKYKCILWPWDVTFTSNKQQLLEVIGGRARHVLDECLSYFADVDNYPLLIMLGRRKERIIILDIVNGSCELDQTRACLERTLNPIHDQTMTKVDETTSLSPGWVGGRTAGSIHRRSSFVTAFRLTRALRAVQRPPYVSFYKETEYARNTLIEEKFENKKLSKCSSSESVISPIPSLSISTIEQYPIVYMSTRRAKWFR